jgi:hypothetical protein
MPRTRVTAGLSRRSSTGATSRVIPITPNSGLSDCARSADPATAHASKTASTQIEDCRNDRSRTVGELYNQNSNRVLSSCARSGCPQNTITATSILVNNQARARVMTINLIL